jgi:hypothetical protein
MYPNWDFWFEKTPSGNPGLGTLWGLGGAGDTLLCCILYCIHAKKLKEICNDNVCIISRRKDRFATKQKLSDQDKHYKELTKTCKVERI